MSEKSKKQLELIINVVYIGVIIGLCFIFFKALGYFVPFIIGLLIVTLINPIIKLLQKKLKLKNGNVISIIVLLLTYIIFGSLFFGIIIKAFYLLKDVFSELPKYYRDVIEPLFGTISVNIDSFLKNTPFLVSEEFTEIRVSIINGLQSIVSKISQTGISFISGFINKVPDVLVALIFSIMLSFFISLQYDSVVSFIKIQLPTKISNTFDDMKKLLKNTVFRYFKAVLILMFITFVELSVGFLIIGVHNPIGIALGISLLDALPVFGTGAVMIPWIIIELLQGNFSAGINLVIIYAIVTFIRNILEPKIVGDQLGINPIVSLISVYLGYKLFGVFGMIFFPMFAQILLTLHENGNIKLYK